MALVFCPFVSRRRKPPRKRAEPPGSLYPTLDLHGSTADEAVSRARAWLERSRAEGELTVRLITGRGRHSTGPAVLPGEIEHLLASFATVVSSYEADSGGGAFIVRLRPLAVSRTTRTVPLPADPLLLRQAEESLSELGIAPTPALLAAEIERIRAERNRRAE